MKGKFSRKRGLQPFFSYYGSKYRSFRKYPPPLHDLIVEPFAGGANYATHFSGHDVLLIELDPNTAAAWEFLIGATPKDVLSLPILKKGEDVRDFGLSLQEQCFLGFWFNRASAGRCYKPTGWGLIDGVGWCESNRRRVSRQVMRIKHWKISEASYESAPDIEAMWFIDPPYQQQGKYYPKGSEGIDYQHLGAWCKARKGQVIVCENDGADWLPFQPLFKLKGQKYRTIESVWMSEGAGA